MFVCVRVRACVCVKEREEKRRTACMGLENLHFPRSPQKKEEGEKKKTDCGTNSSTVQWTAVCLCLFVCLGSAKANTTKTGRKKEKEEGKEKEGKTKGKERRLLLMALVSDGCCVQSGMSGAHEQSWTDCCCCC